MSEPHATLNCNGNSVHAVVFDTTQGTSGKNYSNPKPGDPCHPLASKRHAPAIAFQPRYYTRDNKTGGQASEVSPPVCAAESRSRGDAVTAVAYGLMDGNGEKEMSPTITQPSSTGGGHPAAVAFTERTRADGRNFECQEDVAYALTNPGSGGRTHSRQIAHETGVRRLTPTECERLQGFPDGWTGGFSDSARYRMLGNAVAVPVAEWIAGRIAKA